ncbi:MAG TPA: 1-acyl-sn-glycerol-3-phosphate acyltransferase [Candidatus Limnocylindrales bacterium]|nr:1-acyl-sn-glycerol-3-phosphate acyltransferase [Candidatus Limnocylindrales bacterium]
MTAPVPELSAGLHGRATADPGWTYRGLRLLWKVLAWLLGIRLELQGAEHLPRDATGRPTGAWILAGMPHRTWIDAFPTWILLPTRPRLAFFGDAQMMARSWQRRFLIERLGGVVPIPSSRDPKVVEMHLAAARALLDAGAIFELFPETGPASELGHLRKLGAGLGYVALRNQVPIVPVIFGGNDELYWGRRIIVRVLPPLDPRSLAGLAAEAPLPEPGSSAERAAVHRLTATLAETVAPAVMDVHLASVPPPGTVKRGRFLTTMFR